MITSIIFKFLMIKCNLQDAKNIFLKMNYDYKKLLDLSIDEKTIVLKNANKAKRIVMITTILFTAVIISKLTFVNRIDNETK